MQLILIKNYFFVFNTFDILTINFYKQIKIKRIIRIDNIFQKSFIFFFNLISKFDDD